MFCDIIIDIKFLIKFKKNYLKQEEYKQITDDNKKKLSK